MSGQGDGELEPSPAAAPLCQGLVAPGRMRGPGPRQDGDGQVCRYPSGPVHPDFMGRNIEKHTKNVSSYAF